MVCFFFIMYRRPPRPTRTDTRLPHPTRVRSSRRGPLAWPPDRSGSYSVPAEKGNGKCGREVAHEFMDKTARQGLANSAGPGGVRRSSSGRLLTEPASRRHHGGARTFMRTAALVAFLVALLVGTLLAGIYLWWSLSDVEISIHGLIAMTLGCLVTLALEIGRIGRASCRERVCQDV